VQQQRQQQQGLGQQMELSRWMTNLATCLTEPHCVAMNRECEGFVGHGWSCPQAECDVWHRV
jgi:hypothetical protein